MDGLGRAKQYARAESTNSRRFRRRMEQLPKVRKEKHRIIHRRDAEDAEKLLKNEAINYETVSNSSGFYYGILALRSLRLCGNEYYFFFAHFAFFAIIAPLR
ncbi:MAG: hypothetical protein OEN52_04685 [Gammaproteobacteria bacterium]|nr:hypothetical protein [Gammaproteobacteria bacterium]